MVKNIVKTMSSLMGIQLQLKLRLWKEKVEKKEVMGAVVDNIRFWVFRLFMERCQSENFGF